MTQARSSPHEPGWKKSTLRDYFESICIAVIFALFVRTFVFQAFKIPSSSMEDGLLVGDHILVNKFAYAPPPPGLRKLLPYREVRPGDVVVFKYPKDPRRDFIKRVIGVGGDTIAMEERKVIRNRRPLDEPYVYIKLPPSVPPSYTRPEWEEMREVKVRPGEYFVMGDNRLNSEDSRFWGTVPGSHVKGKAELIYWSFDVPDWMKVDEVNPAAPLENKARGRGYTVLHFLDKTRWSRTFKLVR
jgi:signal peptidase I